MAAWKGHKTVADAMKDPDYFDPPRDPFAAEERLKARRPELFQPKSAPEPPDSSSTLAGAGGLTQEQIERMAPQDSDARTMAAALKRIHAELEEKAAQPKRLSYPDPDRELEGALAYLERRKAQREREADRAASLCWPPPDHVELPIIVIAPSGPMRLSRLPTGSKVVETWRDGRWELAGAMCEVTPTTARHPLASELEELERGTFQAPP